jgi:hypothetical protein
MATAWSVVLMRPPWLAGMTPYFFTTKRIRVMPHSRTSRTMVTHHQSTPMIDSPTNAMPVSALSAMGSASLPKFVTRPRLRAMSPSMRSVIISSTNATNDQMRSSTSSPASLRSSHPNTGTPTIRNTVSAFAMFRLLGGAAVSMEPLRVTWADDSVCGSGTAPRQLDLGLGR